MFTNQQLAVSLRATILFTLLLRAVSMMESEKLHSNICSALPADPTTSAYLNSDKSDPIGP